MATVQSQRATIGHLAALYRLTSELLLYPEERRPVFVDDQLEALEDAPDEIVGPPREFLAAPRSRDVDEYLAILELTPPCPLYLGSYIFQEPQSCLGAGASGRNGYMIELAGAYRHFGFEVGSGELADFLPAMIEFLAITLDATDRDGIGLRRRFVERYFEPGLAPMHTALAKYDSPYGLLLKALEAGVARDIAIHANDPLWAEPARVGKPPTPPVLSFNTKRNAVPAGETT